MYLRSGVFYNNDAMRQIGGRRCATVTQVAPVLILSVSKEGKYCNGCDMHHAAALYGLIAVGGLAIRGGQVT